MSVRKRYMGQLAKTMITYQFAVVSIIVSLIYARTRPTNVNNDQSHGCDCDRESGMDESFDRDFLLPYFKYHRYDQLYTID